MGSHTQPFIHPEDLIQRRGNTIWRIHTHTHTHAIVTTCVGVQVCKECMALSRDGGDTPIV